MTDEGEWEISHNNKKKIYITFENLFSLKYGKNYIKIININDNYLEGKFLLTLEKQHYFINIQDNRFYQNIPNNQLEDLIDYFSTNEINIKNYNKILFKENDIYTNSKQLINSIKLSKSNYYYSFKLTNNLKSIYVVIFKILDKYVAISFFNKDKYRLIFLNNYLDLLLYIYKIEIDMKCNPRYTKLLVNYPYKFCDINHNHIRNYFNSFQIFWKY